MPDNPSVQFEHSDVEGGPIVGFGVGLGIAVVLTMIGTWAMLRFMTSGSAPESARDNPWAREDHNEWQLRDHAPESTTQIERNNYSRLSGIPSLEKLALQDPQQDTGNPKEVTVRQQIAEQEAYLSSYGALRQGKNEIVHIPIEKAMSRILSKLKTASGPAPDEFYQAPSRSSSGQASRRAP